MRADRSIFHAFLQHGEEIVQLLAIDEKEILDVEAWRVEYWGFDDEKV
jgi:hypothetical protein